MQIEGIIMLKQKIQEMLRVRQSLYDQNYFDLVGLTELKEILTKDYQETLEFLKDADQYEIMCASDVLIGIIEAFPQYNWIKLFKEKADIITALESPHINKEEYLLNIEEAESNVIKPAKKRKCLAKRKHK